jgi:hypothetical protein
LRVSLATSTSTWCRVSDENVQGQALLRDRSLESMIPVYFSSQKYHPYQIVILHLD